MTNPTTSSPFVSTNTQPPALLHIPLFGVATYRRRRPHATATRGVACAFPVFCNFRATLHHALLRCKSCATVLSVLQRKTNSKPNGWRSHSNTSFEPQNNKQKQGKPKIFTTVRRLEFFPRPNQHSVSHFTLSLSIAREGFKTGNPRIIVTPHVTPGD